MKNKWNWRIDRVLGIILIFGFTIFLALASGCSTQPMPNINIGGMDTCPPAGGVTLTIINGNDKAYMGDDGAIHDDDGGQQPTLGL